MADDDNFDIDIYGDDALDEGAAAQTAGDELNFEDDYNDYQQESSTNHAQEDANVQQKNSEDVKPEIVKQESKANTNENKQNTPQPQREQQQISGTSGSTPYQTGPPRQKPIPQGTRRKFEEGVDNRPMDPGATSALRIADLHWWTTEDDIRGWTNQETIEDEVKSVTFNEHKINGKSKGCVV